jgi:hypothetical protein
MSAIKGPNIITDGLVLALDAANIQSFKGEPTTNILASYVNPTFENGTKTADGWAFDAKTNGTYDYSTDAYNGTYSVRIQNSTISSIAFWRANIPVVSGQKYTMSIYAKNINCPTVPFFSGVNISLDSGQTASFTGINNEWQRFTATFTATATGNAQFYVRTDNNATQGFFLIDNFQIEQKAYATPFVNGTRGTTVATGGGWADQSGNSNHGELVNGPSFNSSNLGNISFDGIDDYVSIPNITMGNGNLAWAISTWTKTSTTVNGLGLGSIISNASGGPVYSMLGVNSGKIVYWTYQNDAWSQKLGIRTINDNEWHLLTWVNNTNSTMAMYVDGSLDATVANSTSGNNNPLDRIGGSWAGRYSGFIANLLIYKDKALTAAEVLQNYNATRRRYGL